MNYPTHIKIMNASGWPLSAYHKHEWKKTHPFSWCGIEECICGAVISNRYGSEIIVNEGSVEILLKAIQK